ncbi:2601_t:CDS:2 [Dentiscutata heterogama]|uniref:2601_t:CDS:1 n=1 Tax=Dentiscutata heterogama TaxID=1316150 RepID=A0ACA9KKI1_9GLOM|nr:2601_t:CDS:2 [Dentiscutata heterogama]
MLKVQKEILTFLLIFYITQSLIISTLRANTSNFNYAIINIALGEKDSKKGNFPNKTDRIVHHLKNCIHFVRKTIAEERAEIFALSNNEEISKQK